jgi:TonB family protein
LIRSLERTEVFTASDLAVLARNTHRLDMSLQVDAEEGEVVVISADNLAVIRVRTTDGTLVDPPRDLFPAPHVYASSTNEPPPPSRFDAASNDACSDGAARIASSQLVARATETPVPAFPIIAVKARIRGRVWVEVVVSETGEVLCARATYSPFGIRDAAIAAAKQWKFTPYEIGGHPVKVTSEILFYFVDVEPKQWEELQRHPPY